MTTKKKTIIETHQEKVIVHHLANLLESNGLEAGDASAATPTAAVAVAVAAHTRASMSVAGTGTTRPADLLHFLSGVTILFQ